MPKESALVQSDAGLCCSKRTVGKEDRYDEPILHHCGSITIVCLTGLILDRA